MALPKIKKSDITYAVHFSHSTTIDAFKVALIDLLVHTAAAFVWFAATSIAQLIDLVSTSLNLNLFRAS